MNGLSLSNAFRYMFPAVVAYSYLYIGDASLFEQVFASLGIIGITTSLAIGSVMYLLYRSFFYDIVIIRIHDKCRRKTDNYRTYLKKRYSIGTHEAMLLWVQIREKYFKDHYSENMEKDASGIHFMYIIGIIAIPFTIWKLIISDFGLALIFLVITLICLVGAFLRDRTYEDTELRYIYSLDDDELDSFASKMLYNRSSTSNKENGA